MSTKDRINEIRARCEAAAPGPWRKGMSGLITDGTGRALFFSEAANANAEFIAHAREDIPYLLEKIERLRNENQAIIEELRYHPGITPCHVCKHYAAQGEVTKHCKLGDRTCFEWRGKNEKDI